MRIPAFIALPTEFSRIPLRAPDSCLARCRGPANALDPRKTNEQKDGQKKRRKSDREAKFFGFGSFNAEKSDVVFPPFAACAYDASDDQNCHQAADNYINAAKGRGKQRLHAAILSRQNGREKRVERPAASSRISPLTGLEGGVSARKFLGLSPQATICRPCGTDFLRKTDLVGIGSPASLRYATLSMPRP